MYNPWETWRCPFVHHQTERGQFWLMQLCVASWTITFTSTGTCANIISFHRISYTHIVLYSLFHCNIIIQVKVFTPLQVGDQLFTVFKKKINDIYISIQRRRCFSNVSTPSYFKSENLIHLWLNKEMNSLF